MLLFLGLEREGGFVGVIGVAGVVEVVVGEIEGVCGDEDLE